MYSMSDAPAGGAMQFAPQLHDATRLSSAATYAQLDPLAEKGRRMHLCARSTGSARTGASAEADTHGVDAGN